MHPILFYTFPLLCATIQSQTQACQKLMDEADIDHKNMLERIDEGRESMNVELFTIMFNYPAAFCVSPLLIDYIFRLRSLSSWQKHKLVQLVVSIPVYIH